MCKNGEFFNVARRVTHYLN